MIKPGALEPDESMAVTAWNIMGGIDWNALPVVAEMLGVQDVEMLIVRLVVLRAHQNKRPDQ